MSFHTDHSAILADSPGESQNLLSSPCPDIEDNVARFGLVVPQKDGSGPRVQARQVQTDVAMVVGEMAAGGLLDPDTIVIKDPRNAARAMGDEVG